MISTGIPALISRAVFQIPSLRLAIKLDFLKEIDNACTELCKRKATSVLRGHHFNHLAQFSWSNILKEMSAQCEDLLEVLSTVTRGNRGAVIGMAYGMLMQARNHEMSLCQRINTVLLMDGGAKKQVCYLLIILVLVIDVFAFWGGGGREFDNLSHSGLFFISDAQLGASNRWNGEHHVDLCVGLWKSL